MYFSCFVDLSVMKRELEVSDPNKTEINLLRLYQHDPERLFSDAELVTIQNWNKMCCSNRHDGPLLLTSESLWCRQQTAEPRLDWCPLEVYCTVLYDNALVKHNGGEPNKPYSVAELTAFHPEIKDWKTMRKYVDILDEVGLLKRVRTSKYYQRAQTDTFGPIFETLATEGDDTDIAFVGFPGEQLQSDSIIGFARLPSWTAVKQSFWNERLAGVTLVLFGMGSAIQLFLRVYRNTAVSMLDLAIAYVLTWILLIGVFALVIGHLRRRAPAVLQRDLLVSN